MRRRPPRSASPPTAGGRACAPSSRWTAAVLDLRLAERRSPFVAMKSSTSSRAYQTSRFGFAANSRMVVRYALATLSSRSRRSLRPKPLPRAAISTLASRRLTSHSNGPGSVSSKSLRSNRSRRSGRAVQAEVRQVRVTAQLHVEAGVGRRRQVRRHDQRGAAVERERGGHHPAVPERHQLGQPRVALRDQQLDRGRAARTPDPTSASASRGSSTRAAAPRAARSSRVRCVTGSAARRRCGRSGGSAGAGSGLHRSSRRSLGHFLKLGRPQACAEGG